MLAQRQRELLTNHLRQRQVQQAQQAQQQQQQQRSITMRAQGLNLPHNMAAANAAVAAAGGASGNGGGGMGNARIPQGNPQQFPYPPSYGTGTGLASPPPSTSPFSSPLSPGLPPLPPNPQLHLHGSSSSSSSSSSQMMMGNSNMMGGGQYGAVLSPQMQHSAFQFPNSALEASAGLGLLHHGRLGMAHAGREHGALGRAGTAEAPVRLLAHTCGKRRQNKRTPFMVFCLWHSVVTCMQTITVNK
ncbi:hypothetical protein CRUP_013060 [Coryphaenoides rupestris]|nr:hypothetical protein CRUP_013060 [Coryphaenoides rupestris]